jgi:regulator of sirC expression with transglutaminase-like and TPR domain
MTLPRRDCSALRQYLTETPQVSLTKLISLTHQIWSEGQIPLNKTLKRLDFLFHDWNSNIQNIKDPIEVLASLNDFMFKREAFKASLGLGVDGLLISRICETRECHPFMMSLLYQEMANRTQVAATDYIRFADVYMMKTLIKHQLFFLAPAESGRLVSVAELEGRILKMLRKPIQSLGPFIETPSTTSLFVRYLSLLKEALMTQRLWDDVIFVLDLLIEVNPLRLDEFRERGVLLYQMNEFDLAYKDLNLYLTQSPPTPEHEKLKVLLKHLKAPERHLTPIH